MMDEDFALLCAHRNNIDRYRRLLTTKLSDIERAYITGRLGEEEAIVQALLSAALPLDLAAPGDRPY